MAPPQGALVSGHRTFFSQSRKDRQEAPESVPLRTLRLGEIKSLLASKIRLVPSAPGTSLHPSHQEPGLLPHPAMSPMPFTLQPPESGFIQPFCHQRLAESQTAET
jgi:hypothetical protein